MTKIKSLIFQGSTVIKIKSFIFPGGTVVTWSKDDQVLSADNVKVCQGGKL